MADCIDPNALAEGQLGAYAADPSDDDPIVVQHLQQCPACQAEVAKMQTLTMHLRTELYRVDCLTTETITDLAANRLSPARRRTAERHLQSCTRCREDLAFSTLALADRDPILDWRAPTLTEQVASGVRRVVATMIEALAPGTPDLALGVNLRSAGASSASRPRLYHAEDVTLSLRAVPDAGGAVQIEGMITSAADPTLALAELPVRLYMADAAAPPRLIAEDTTDGGMFLLGPVPPSQFELEVQLPDRIIAIEALTF